MPQRSKVFFVSDLHLGAPDYASSLRREKIFVEWLESIEEEVKTLYLIGDVFDFWFEFGKVVPQGYVRILGKLASLADKGVELHIFTGNHDFWYFDYLKNELPARIHYRDYTVTHFGKKLYLAHGDGLGPGDWGYKFIKAVFTFPLFKWLYARIHPNTSTRLAEFFSRLSGSYTKREVVPVFYGEKEAIIIHSRQLLQHKPDIHCFIYGHRHIMREYALSEQSKCIYLGDWIQYFSYAEMDETGIFLRQFKT